MNAVGWVWLWITLILVLIMVAVTLSRVTVYVHAQKMGADEEITADVNLLFGIIKMHYEVPKIMFHSLKKGFKIHTSSDSNVMPMDDQTQATHVGVEKVKVGLEMISRMKEATAGLGQWWELTLKHFKITQLYWSTQFAFREADHTAVASGLLWSLKWCMVGSTSYRVNLKTEPKLYVHPQFGVAPHFATEINCIAQITLGYAMYVGMNFMIRVLKVKGGIKQWRSILSKG